MEIRPAGICAYTVARSHIRQGLCKDGYAPTTRPMPARSQDVPPVLHLHLRQSHFSYISGITIHERPCSPKGNVGIQVQLCSGSNAQH